MTTHTTTTSSTLAPTSLRATVSLEQQAVNTSNSRNKDSFATTYYHLTVELNEASDIPAMIDYLQTNILHDNSTGVVSVLTIQSESSEGEPDWTNPESHDNYQQLFQCLASLPTLHKIQIKDVGMGRRKFPISLMTTLLQNSHGKSHLKCLDLDAADLIATPEDLHAFALVLRQNHTSVDEFYLEFSDWAVAGCSTATKILMQEAFLQLPLLHTLSIRAFIEMGTVDSASLRSLLANAGDLQQFRLEFFDLQDEHMESIAEGLHNANATQTRTRTTSIVNIDISYCTLEKRGIRAIADIIQLNLPTLQQLKIGVSDQREVDDSDYLLDNDEHREATTRNHTRSSWTDLVEPSLTTIATALQSNNTLTHLDLHGRPRYISNATRIAFANTLERYNFTLERLQLLDGFLHRDNIDCMPTERLRFFLRLNRNGNRKKLLETQAKIVPVMDEWINVMANHSHDVPVLHYYLQHNPALLLVCQKQRWK